MESTGSGTVFVSSKDPFVSDRAYMRSKSKTFANGKYAARSGEVIAPFGIGQRVRNEEVL